MEPPRAGPSIPLSALERLRQLAAALGDTHRLDLLRELLDGPRMVTQLVQATQLPQPLVSHHLAVLARAGLIHGRRDGRRRWYELRDDAPDVRPWLALFREAAGSAPLPAPAWGPAGTVGARPAPPASAPPASAPLDDWLL